MMDLSTQVISGSFWKIHRKFIPGLVMTIHTFGNYPEKFHPHLHAIVVERTANMLKSNDNFLSILLTLLYHNATIQIIMRIITSGRIYYKKPCQLCHFLPLWAQ